MSRLSEITFSHSHIRIRMTHASKTGPEPCFPTYNLRFSVLQELPQCFAVSFWVCSTQAQSEVSQEAGNQSKEGLRSSQRLELILKDLLVCCAVMA